MGYKREHIAIQYRVQGRRDPGGTGSVTRRVSEHRTCNIPPQTDGILRMDLMGDRSHASIAVVSVVIVKQELSGGHHRISC